MGGPTLFHPKPIEVKMETNKIKIFRNMILLYVEERKDVVVDFIKYVRDYKKQ